jgi:hypothetical protein
VDYLRYYVGPLMQIGGILGLLAGGPWVWFGVAELPLLALGDALLGDDTRERARVHDGLMDVPLVLCALLGFALLGTVAWTVGQGALTGAELVGTILSGGWLAVVPIVPALHELYHKRTPWKVALGTYSQIPYLDCTRSVAHVMGHHLHVGTPLDADTPQRGESVYGFIARTIPENYRQLYASEKAALARRGLSVWSWRGRFLRAIAAYAAFVAAVLAIGGAAGAAAAIATTVIGRVWVEAFNYLQHCGLIRVEGQPIGGQHVWNHLGTLSRMAGFEIATHKEHHLDAYIPYYRLKPDAEGPRMPSAFLCFLASLVPPLWNRLVLWPRLRDWDARLATSGERELARQRNREAGWPDWQAGSAA